MNAYKKGRKEATEKKRGGGINFQRKQLLKFHGQQKGRSSSRVCLPVLKLILEAAIILPEECTYFQDFIYVQNKNKSEKDTNKLRSRLKPSIPIV